MVQFLSMIFFFLDFFNFCWGFQKFPFFFVSLCILSYLRQEFLLQELKAISPYLKKKKHQQVNHTAWGPFSIRRCRQFKVSAFFTSVCSTSWTHYGNAYPLLSRRFTPYHVISKIRVRNHNTGPITVMTLIDSYSLHQFPYESNGGTRRLQATDRKNCDCWWRESKHDPSSEVYSVAQSLYSLSSPGCPSPNDA